MDPVSVLGVTGSIISIVGVISKSLQSLLALQTKYKKANLTVSLLIGQLSTLKAALNQISAWINTSLVNAPRHQQLVTDLTTSLDGCEVLILPLNERLNHLQKSSTVSLDTMGRVQLLWGEKDMQEYLNQLNNQISALNLLLTALQCRSLFEQGNLLRSEESRHLFKTIQDNTSSLLWLRDVESNYTTRSILVDNFELFDTNFEFDGEIFASRAYREAMKSHMKRAIAGKSTDQRDSGPCWAKDWVVFDHAMARAIIENHDGDSQTRKEHIGELSPPGNGFVDDVSDADGVRPLVPITEIITDQTQRAVRDQSMISTSKSLVKPEGDPWKLPGLTARTTEHTHDRTQRKLRRALIKMPHLFTRMINIDFQRNSKGNSNSMEGIRITVEEQRQEDMMPKVLLLGASESGKSTLLKSLKLLHEGTYTTSERTSFKEVIFTIVVQSMRVILEAMEALEITLDDQQNKYFVQTMFMQTRVLEQDTLTREVADAIRILWHDVGVVTCFQRSREYQLPNCAEYFFNAIYRLARTNYLPTDQDILRTRIKTTGITETCFSMNGNSYWIYDVGGTRSERKKWIHVFGSVDTILFMVDIAAYDRLLFEDETMNRMQEQLILFDSICNSRWFVKTHIVLLFHKVDMLKEKLEKSPMETYFPDYSGGKDFEAAKYYISNRFLELNQHADKTICVHFTDIEDEMRFAEVARDSIIEGIARRPNSTSTSISTPIRQDIG